MKRTAFGLVVALGALSLAAEISGLLGGALLYLAKKENLQLSLVGLPLSLLGQRVAFDPDASLDEFVQRWLPGYRLVREGSTARIVPQEAVRRKGTEAGPVGVEAPASSTPSAPAPAPAFDAKGTLKGRVELRYILPGGETEEVGFPEGVRVLGVIQERGEAKGGEITLALSPFEITCIEEAGEAVCLRPLAWQGEGDLEVSLAGRVYRIRYRVESSPLLLRKVSLDGSYAPMSLQVVPIVPLVPPKPPESRPAESKPAAKAQASGTTAASSKGANQGSSPLKPPSTATPKVTEGYYVLNPKGAYKLGPLSMAKFVNPRGTWVSAGTYCNLKSPIFSSLPKNHLLKVLPSSCVQVLVPNTSEGWSFARRFVSRPALVKVP